MLKRFREPFRRAMVACAVMVTVSTTVFADEIRLRSSVVLDANRPVVVGDVAVLTGDEAIKGAGAVIAPSAGELAKDASGRGSVTIARVREALANSGVMVARIAMSGSTCVVRIASPVGVPAPAPLGAEPEAPKASAYTIDSEAGPITVRRRVAESIARTYGVGEGDVRMTFEPRDEQLLSIEEGGRAVIVRPMTTGNSARPLMEVRVVSGERVVASGTVAAEVEVWRTVVIAAGDIARHSPIQPGMVREESRWMAPGGAPVLAHAGEVGGQRAARRLRTGDVVVQSDIEGVIAVKRGEVVVVECVRNGIALQAKARAMGDGRVGDRVECRVGDSRKTFVGTVDAVGRVVVVLGSGETLAGS